MNTSISISKTAKRMLDSILPALKAVNLQFVGIINLSRELTHYQNTIIITDNEILLDLNPIIGGGAEIRMIGDGSHTPLFSAFTKSKSSGDYDPTLNSVNKIVFYYDGTEAFYSITVL